MNNRKKMILGAILLMAVGFATVATTLFINGSTTIGQNLNDFDVVFSKALQNGNDVSDTVISQDKKTITYDTKDLAMIDDEDELVYTVTNNSTQYDAEIEINCTNDNTTYISLSNVLSNNIVEAKKSVDGSIKAKLIKEYADEAGLDVSFSCTLQVNAIERTSAGEPDQIQANNVSFTPSNPNWNVNSVDEALDYLFANN